MLNMLLNHVARWRNASIIAVLVVLAVLSTEFLLVCLEWLIRSDISVYVLMLGFIVSIIVAGFLGALLIHILSERKRYFAETVAVKNSLSLLNATLESTADAILVVDVNGMISGYNQQFVHMWQVPPKILAERDDEAAIAHVLNQLQEPESFFRKVRELHAHPESESFDNLALKDGRQVERYSRPQMMDQVAVGRVWSFRDVTQRKQAEYDLNAAKDMLQIVIETIPARVFWKDRESRYMGANTLFAMDAGESDVSAIIGKDDTQLTWRNQAELYRADDKWVMDLDITKLAFEEPQTTPAGDQIWLRTSKVPFKNELGQVIGVLGVYDDITRIKETERELAITQAAIDQGLNNFLRVDAGGYISYANDAACNMFGYSRDELLGMGVWEIDHYLVQEAWSELWQRVINQGLVAQETKMSCKDGRLVSVEVNATYCDYQGESFAFVFIQDISARKQVARELFSTSRTYLGVINSLSEAVYILDMEGRFLEVNDAALRLYGYPRELFIGNTPEPLLALELNDMNSVAATMARAFNGEAFVTEIWGKRRNGEIFPKEMHFSPGSYFGQPCIIALAMDITLRKQAEARLQASEARWKFALEGASTGVWDWQVGTDEMYISAHLKALFGFQDEEVLNSQTEWTSRIHPYDVQSVTLNLEGYLSGKQERYAIEHRVQDKQASYQWIRIRGMVTQRDEQGLPVRMVGTGENITDRKLAENELHKREADLAFAAKTANLGYWEYENETDEFIFNDHYYALHKTDVTKEGGYRIKRERFTKRFVYTEDTDLVGIYTQELIAAGDEKTTRELESRILCTDGEIRWVLIRIKCEFEPSGKPIRLRGISLDITRRKLMEEELQLAAQVYQGSSEAIMVTDEQNRIIAVNPAFTIVTGYSADEVIGRDPAILKSNKHSEDFYQLMWRQIDTTGHWQGEIWNRRKSGEVYAEWLTVNTLYHVDHTVHRRVALFSDITEKKRSEELIWQQANFDTLTKLPNRRMFRDRLEQDSKKSNREHLSLALLFIDLDRFKEVNDSFGHDAGDALLIEAAQRIALCVRDADTVARLGGDEFTIILGEIQEFASVERIAQSVVDALALPFVLGEEMVYVSASVGITLYPNDAKDIETLIKNADQAMYEAKRAGKNRFSYFTASLQLAAQERIRLAYDLRGALANNQLSVYYQPIVDLESGAIRKAEALLRWHHPVRGLVEPAAFISLAEESGIISAIGDWVFRVATQQVHDWHSSYRADFQVSVNKSAVQFRDDDQMHSAWVDRLVELDLPGNSIVIEITESVLLNSDKGTKDRLLNFRDVGIQVALDDFGTGYSSLAYLKRFDIDFLKIDQMFVKNLEDDEDDRALCEAIIVMAHKLGLKVIAEGVETAFQGELLKAMGCDYGQGFLYSRPVPVEEFNKLLAGTLGSPVAR